MNATYQLETARPLFRFLAFLLALFMLACGADSLFPGLLFDPLPINYLMGIIGILFSIKYGVIAATGRDHFIIRFGTSRNSKPLEATSKTNSFET